MAGDSASAIYPLRALVADKRLTGTCPSGYLSSTTNHPYVYVELVNRPSRRSRSVRGTLRRRAAVRSSTPPSGLPCGDSKWAGLTTTKAITLPPFGSALVYFGSYYPAGGASASEGDVKLVVRTDALE